MYDEMSRKIYRQGMNYFYFAHQNPFNIQFIAFIHYCSSTTVLCLGARKEENQANEGYYSQGKLKSVDTGYIRMKDHEKVMFINLDLWSKASSMKN